jgi:putative MFS transporter
VERRWFIVVDACIIAACGVLYGATVNPVMIVTFGALVVMTTQAMAVALYTYTPELFVTDLRSSGMGLTYGVGRLANIFGPFIIGGLFAASGYLSVFVFISACWLAVGAIVAARGLSTTGRSLDELNPVT